MTSPDAYQCTTWSAGTPRVRPIVGFRGLTSGHRSAGLTITWSGRRLRYVPLTECRFEALVIVHRTRRLMVWREHLCRMQETAREGETSPSLAPGPT